MDDLYFTDMPQPFITHSVSLYVDQRSAHHHQTEEDILVA